MTRDRDIDTIRHPILSFMRRSAFALDKEGVKKREREKEKDTREREREIIFFKMDSLALGAIKPVR